VKVSGNEQLKQRLEGISQSGVTGSALGGMPEAIAEIKASDAAKGDELMQDYNELAKANSPDKVKVIAQKMLDKLK